MFDRVPSVFLLNKLPGSRSCYEIMKESQGQVFVPGLQYLAHNLRF